MHTNNESQIRQFEIKPVAFPCGTIPSRQVVIHDAQHHRPGVLWCWGEAECNVGCLFWGAELRHHRETVSMSTHRKQLLAIMANIEQQIAEAQSLMVDVPDDEILLGALKQLAELKRLLEVVEKRLRERN